MSNIYIPTSQKDQFLKVIKIIPTIQGQLPKNLAMLEESVKQNTMSEIQFKAFSIITSIKDKLDRICACEDDVLRYLSNHQDDLGFRPADAFSNALKLVLLNIHLSRKLGAHG